MADSSVKRKNKPRPRSPAAGREHMGLDARRRLGRAQVPGLAVGAALVVLSVAATGAPGLVMGVGAAALIAALAHRPGWSPPAALAGGAVLFVGTLGLATIAASVAFGGALGQARSVTILATPLALASLIIVVVPRRPQPASVTDGKQFWLPVCAAVGTVLTLAWLLQLHLRFGAAWAMSGDARNHVILMRDIINAGGLEPGRLKAYPALYNALAAVHSAAAGRPRGSAGALLEHDVNAMAAIYVLTFALIAALLLAGAFQVVGAASMTLSRTGGFSVAAAAVLIALSPIVAGTALTDGFFSAVGGLALMLSVLLLCTQASAAREMEPALVAVGGCLLLLTVWSLLALLAAPLLMVVAATFARHRRLELAAVLILAGLAPVVAFYLQRATVKPILTASGALTVPAGSLLLALIAVAGSALLLNILGSTARHALSIALVLGTTAVVLMVWLLRLAHADIFTIAGKPTWTYYAGKTLWLSESALAFVLLVPAAAATLSGAAPTRLRRELAPAVCAGAAVCVMWMGSVLPQPITSATTGWANPNAETARAVFAQDSRPFVFFRWSTPASYNGEDRLANFWAAAIWSTGPQGEPLLSSALPGGMAAWAYRAGGTDADLCELGLAVPGIRVITRDSTLEARMGAVCKGHFSFAS